MSVKLPRLPIEIQDIILTDSVVFHKLTLLSKYHYELAIKLQPEILVKLYENVIEKIFVIDYEKDRDRLLKLLCAEFLDYLNGEFDLDIYTEFFYWLISNRVELEKNSLSCCEFEGLLEEFSETMYADLFHFEISISRETLSYYLWQDYRNFIKGGDKIPICNIPETLFMRAVENIPEDLSISKMIERCLDIGHIDIQIYYFNILIRGLIATKRTTVKELDSIFVERFEDGMIIETHTISYEHEFGPDLKYFFYLSREEDTFILKRIQYEDGDDYDSMYQFYLNIQR